MSCAASPGRCRVWSPPRWGRHPAARRAGCANTARRSPRTRRRATCASSVTSRPREKADIYTPELRERFARDATAEAFGVRLAASAAHDLLGRLQDLDCDTYLPDDILAKVDIASMSHGLEARAPFCDHDVVEIGAALPGHYKLRNGKGKHVLKQAFADLVPTAHPRAQEEGVRAADRALAGRPPARIRARPLALRPGARARPVRAWRRRDAARAAPRWRGSRRTDLEPHGARDLVPRARRRTGGFRTRSGGAPGGNRAVRRARRSANSVTAVGKSRGRDPPRVPG